MSEPSAKKAKRGRPRRPEPPLPEELVGRRQVADLLRHRRRLRNAYPHGNRTLHYDTVLITYLLAFFNPTLRSLRTIQDFSKVPGANQYLDVEQVARSTLSDANRLFDPGLLEPLIQSLHAQIPAIARVDAKLGQLLKQLRLVDGSFFAVAADVEWALRKRKAHNASTDDRFVRLDLQMCSQTGVPECLEINGKGTSEVAAAQRHIEPGVVYVADRGIFSFSYVQAMLDGEADFVLRIKTSQLFQAQKELPLTAEDRQAGVLSDRVGVLTGNTYRSAPQSLLREVRIADPNNPGHVVRLLTSLMDIPAHLVGAIYRRRWQIELFFRWLKVHAHFRHLTSHSRNGITLGFYVATIGVLLLYLHTGRRPSKYAFSLLCMVGQGMATLRDILPILEARERENDLARKRLARKKAEKAGR